MLQKKELQIYRKSEFKVNRDAPHSPHKKTYIRNISYLFLPASTTKKSINANHRAELKTENEFVSYLNASDKNLVDTSSSALRPVVKKFRKCL
jgi:uncharacterized protein (DUF2461 family)